MLKIIDAPKKQDVIIRMSKMKPLQVGVITFNSVVRSDIGKCVMRTSSLDQFEVMDMSNPGEDQYWEKKSCKHISVAILPPSESITIELYNE